MESSSEEQKECVWGGSYLSECSLLPTWLVFLCLKLAITSFKQQLEELLMTQLGRHWGEGRSFPRMKDFPISEQESTQENLFKKKGTDGWVAASMSSQSFQTWILGFLLLEVEFLNRLPSMWWNIAYLNPTFVGLWLQEASVNGIPVAAALEVSHCSEKVWGLGRLMLCPSFPLPGMTPCKLSIKIQSNLQRPFSNATFST